jgi:hypothetical protein
MLTPSLLHTSSSQLESKNEGFFLTTYKVDEKDMNRLKDIGFFVDTIWAEKSWGYACTYFGKKKVENWKTNLIFPVTMSRDSSFYLSYSFDLDPNQRDFTSGYDLINYRYSFSPSELSDTLDIMLSRRDSIDGQAKKSYIDTIRIIKNTN